MSMLADHTGLDPSVFVSEPEEMLFWRLQTLGAGIVDLAVSTSQADLPVDLHTEPLGAKAFKHYWLRQILSAEFNDPAAAP